MEENQLDHVRQLVLIGGSAGSLDVLLQVLPKLTDISSIALVIVLHRRNSDDAVLEELLRMKTAVTVREIEDKTPIRPGSIYVAPADYHLLFETNNAFSLDVSEKVHHSRPSIDVAFESAAVAFGDRVVAILLSGANSDGAEGLAFVKENNGVAVVQSPETAEVAYMPQSALERLTPDFVLSPKEIASFVKGL